MADNTTLNSGSGGDVISTDDLGSVKVQRVKVQYGVDGSATDVSTSNPLPVELGSTSLAALENISATVSDGGGSITVDGTVELGSTSLAALESLTTISTVTTVGAVTSITNALPAGTNNIGDVDVLSVVPGTSATSLGKAEDAAYASGDTGVMVLAVRNDAGTALAGTTGNYIPLSTDSSGALRVVGSSGTTQYAEDVASAGGESLCLAGFVRQDTISSSTSADGDYAYGKVNANGAQYVALESGGITGRAEDSAHSSGHEGVVILAVRRDSASSGVDADGDYATLSVDSSGNLRTTGNIATIGTSVTPGTGATNLGKAEDAAHTSGDVGVMALAVRQDTLATLSSATGDYEPIHLDASGRVYANAQVTAQATGGFTPGKLNSAASTNATSVKGSAGTLAMCVVTNTNAAVRYLKFYNKATAPTVGTDTPVLVIAVPGSTTGGGVAMPIPPQGIAFSTGIAFAMTTGAADSDTTGVAANELIVSYAYA